VSTFDLSEGVSLVTVKAKKAVSFINYGLIVMTVTHVLTHVFGGVHPAIFSILREEFSLSLQQLGIIAAIPPLLQAIVSIPTGLLSDKFGSKRMVLVSLVVALLGALLASQTTNPLMFIVAISIVYLNTTIYHPASYSYTSNLFEGRDRPKALGLHGAGGTLEHAIGPLSVSILIGLLGMEWRQVYLLLGAPLLLGIVMLFFLKDGGAAQSKEVGLEKGAVDAPSIKSILSKSMVMFLSYSALRMMGGSMISNFIVLYLQDVRHLDLALASLIASGTMLFGFVAAPIGGFIAARFGEKKWILGTFSLGCILLAFSLFVPNAMTFAILYIGYGFCNTLGMAGRSSIMAILSPKGQRGLGYALFFLPGSIMGAIAPVIAGFVAQNYGFTTVFYLSLGIFALAIGVLRFLVKVE
jgi:MFS family permease